MATYTVLSQSEEANSATVVVEFAVPAGNNDAGVASSQIVSQVRTADGLSGTTVNPRRVGNNGFINQLNTGSLVEASYTHHYNRYLGNAAKAAALDAGVTAFLNQFTTDFASRYRFYGTERTV